MISVLELTIGGIIGIILQYLVIRIDRWWSSKSKAMHGVWYEILPPFQGLTERIDKIRLQQNGNRLTGRAWRISPVDENNRTWHFEGYVSGNKLMGFFYIDDKGIDPSSYIPVIMVRDTHSRYEAVWRGHYYRPEYENDEDIISGDVATGEMWWQRSNPDKKRLNTWLGNDSQQFLESDR